MADFLGEIAPLLGIILPSIAAYFVYRRTETKREVELKQAEKMPSLIQAGAFAGEHAPRLIADAITGSAKMLAEKMDEAQRCMDEEAARQRTWRKDILERLETIERHFGRVARVVSEERDKG